MSRSIVHILLSSVGPMGLVVFISMNSATAKPAMKAKQNQREIGSIEEQLKFQAGDEKGNEIKALKTELLVMKSEQKALSQLEKLRTRYRGTRMEPEILFRLGEIYMRRARSERFFEIHRDSKQIVHFAPTLVTQASEKKQIKKAIDIYIDMEKRFPRFRSRDIVVFNTAYAYQQVGDTASAEKQYIKLLKEHAQSSLVPDSLLSLGEIEFSKRKFADALIYFLKIKNYPSARVYPYGIYKAAWTKYNLQDEAGGLKLLEEVLAFGHAQSASGLSQYKLDLRKEALGDMALFYSEIRNPKDAVSYFIAQAKDLDAVPYILRLVEIYKRHSKYKEVDTVLRDVLDKVPKTDLIANVRDELIWNAERQKRRDVAVKELVALNRECDRLEIRKACDDKVVEVSKKLGAKFHAYWKKEKTPETADYALKAYEIYLEKAEIIGHEAAQVRFAYADLLFSRTRYREASQNYALVYEGELTPKAKKSGFSLMKTDPKLAVDASYAAIVALEKAVGEAKWSDSDETRFNELSERYLKMAPNGQYAVDIQFKRAFIAYEKERYDIASSGFQKIGWAKENFDHPKGVKSQDLYLDILNIRKDYKGLKKASQQLLTIAESVASSGGKAIEKSRKDQIAKIRREAWFAEIGEFEHAASASPSLREAANQYRAFAVAPENKDSELSSRAWWNASQILFKSGDIADAAGMCMRLPIDFPKSEKIQDCLTQAVQTYESIARLDLAANGAKLLIDVDKGHAAKWKVLSSEFMALSGQQQAKMTAITELIGSVDEKGMTEAHRSEALEKAFLLAKEMGDQKRLSQIRLKIESLGIEPQASRFLLEEAEAAYRSGDANRAFNFAKKIVGNASHLSMEKSIPARARFLQARILEDEYQRQSVKAKVERIGIVLAIKTEKLEKAQKAYQAAGKMGDVRVAIDAQSRLADIYLDYAKVVRTMQLPADVPESDRQAFAKEIEQIALPMEEKGVEALSQALDAAKKSSRLDGLAGTLQDKLDRVNLRHREKSKIVVEPLPRLVPAFGWKLIGWRAITLPIADRTEGGEL